jgi:Icc-related predicted phosphoesterase
MKILLSVDSHGKALEMNEKADLILIGGDFVKGDALRKFVFDKGTKEEVEKEIMSSAKAFLENLKKANCPIIATLGNAEDFCKDKIVELLKKQNIIYKRNGVVEVLGLKILLIDFFVEEWWAKKHRPDRISTIERGKREEEELKKILKKIYSVDIILSHLPPYGILDFGEDNPEMKLKADHAGSKVLRDFILEKKPRLVVCGHIHTPGEEMLGVTLIINPDGKKVIEFN